MADSRDRTSNSPIEFPGDLAAVLVVLALTDLSLLAPIIRETPLRIVTGFVVLLFLPGYALVSFIFPESEDGGEPDADPTTEATDEPPRRGVDGIERVVLAIALSLVIVMGTALGLHTAGVPIGLESTLAVLNVVILAVTAGAAYRRQQIPIDDRFRPDLGGVARELRAEARDFDRTDRILTILFIVTLVFAGAGAAYTAVSPSEDESFTEFYLLAEDADGKLTASEYPTDFTVGESESLTVGVENHEFERVNYTIVVQLENTSRRNADAEVVSQRELHRFTTTLGHDERWRNPHEITTQRAGRNLRLQYLLYRGEPPRNPSQRNAYRHVHLWINSTAAE